MAFIKKTWKDRLSEFPKRWKLKLLSSSGANQSVELELDDGTVITQGDRFNAATMNDLEQRIEDAFNSSSAGVSSFNSRSGAVTPASGDYSSNQISHLNTDTTETNVQDEINGLKNSVAEKLPTYESDSSSWDTLPIENSTKPITSGGVFASLPQMSYVGMIIHSTTLDTEAKVKAFYGGTTWTKIEGRFLLGTSSSHAINTTGGSETVTLTINQIPSHSHSLVPNTTNTAIYTGTGRYDDTETSGGRNHIVNNNTGATGGGQAHDNMPPFRSVYIWVRTA